MPTVIDSLAKALKHHMLIRVECPKCESFRIFRPDDLARLYGRGRDPRSLGFRCQLCSLPRPLVTALAYDRERAGTIMVWRPMRVTETTIGWRQERLKR